MKITVSSQPSRSTKVAVANKSVGGLTKADGNKLAKLVSEVA